jgi:hypothetical protein
MAREQPLPVLRDTAPTLIRIIGRIVDCEEMLKLVAVLRSEQVTPHKSDCRIDNPKDAA